MNNKIQLNDLIPVNPDEYQKYRLHFAKPVFDKETGNRYFPLQVLHNQLFEADNDDWDQWQTVTSSEMFAFQKYQTHTAIGFILQILCLHHLLLLVQRFGYTAALRALPRTHC